MRKCIILNGLLKDMFFQFINHRHLTTVLTHFLFHNYYCFVNILFLEQFKFIALGWERYGKFSYAHSSPTCNLSSMMLS